MGYNISDVSGNGQGGLDQWNFFLDLAQPGVTTVSGDFNVVSIFGGFDLGEATDGYTFSPLSTTAYGSLATNTTDGTFTFTVDRAAVMASGTDQVVSFTITGTSGGQSDDDTIFINILICVARGTLVATLEGQKPVEDIRPGDMVRTKDGGAKPVRWIGSRRVDGAELAADPALRPIRIAAGALGRNRPRRDLVVSPQHRVLISDWRAELMFSAHEVLVPAKALLDGETVRVETGASEVEYFHLLFDDHEIIYTEGAPTESFHPGGYSLRELGDAARVELHKLFPGLFTGEDAMATARTCLRPWEGALLPRPAAAPAPAASEAA